MNGSFKKAFYKSPQYNVKKSFDEIQNAPIEEYGRPKTQEGKIENYDIFATWKRYGLKINHYIIDRFGPENILTSFLKELS
jgi:hypothetical protein